MKAVQQTAMPFTRGALKARLMRQVASGKPDEEGILWRRRTLGEPGVPAVCPACQREPTRWRGPHPEVCPPGTAMDVAHSSDLPIAVIDGEEVALRPRPGEGRLDSAARLYRVADKWRDGPQPACALPGVVMWQAALCGPCEDHHRLRWLDAVFPEGRRRRPPLGGDGGGGDWLDV